MTTIYDNLFWHIILLHQFHLFLLLHLIFPGEKLLVICFNKAKSSSIIINKAKSIFEATLHEHFIFTFSTAMEDSSSPFFHYQYLTKYHRSWDPSGRLSIKKALKVVPNRSSLSFWILVPCFSLSGAFLLIAEADSYICKAPRNTQRAGAGYIFAVSSVSGIMSSLIMHTLLYE